MSRLSLSPTRTPPLALSQAQKRIGKATAIRGVAITVHSPAMGRSRAAVAETLLPSGLAIEMRVRRALGASSSAGGYGSASSIARTSKREN